jgi:hypothetical protein
MAISDVNRIIVVCLLLAMAFVAQRAEASSFCTLNSTARVLSPEQTSMLFGGFNDILGPIITNLPFDFEAVQSLTRRMRVGALRHPGGTVANFWSLENGTYTQPCDDIWVPLGGNHCKYAADISNNGLPWGSFTPGKFFSAFENSLCRSGANYSVVPIVWNLNILTLSDDAMLQQVNLIASQVQEAAAKNATLLIELGNEFFISVVYGLVFPNSTVYGAKIAPLVKLIRQLLPTARIAAVSDPRTLGWDAGLAQLLEEDANLFDAVTVHDYNCQVLNLTSTSGPSWEQLALYGPTTSVSIAEHVAALFPSKSVWMTEFNVGPLGFDALKAVNLTSSVLHSLFVVNYIIGAACQPVAAWDVMMLHMLWQQAGMDSSLLIWLMGWGVAQVPANRTVPDPLRHTSWTAMGQIMSHILEFAHAGASGGVCLEAAPGCPSSAVVSSSPSCLRGVLFGNRYALVTNGCGSQPNISARIPLPTRAGPLNVTSFEYLSTSPVTTGTATLADCTPTLHLWECGPLVPLQQPLHPQNTSWLEMNVSAFSILLIQFW